MRKKSASFQQSFKEDLQISLIFSVFGMLGFVGRVPHPLPLKIVIGVAFCLVSATLFAGVLAAAQTWVMPRAKVPSFLLAVILVSLTYLAVILIALPLTVALMVSLVAQEPPWSPTILRVVAEVVRPIFILPAFGLMVSITFFFMLQKKLGPGVLQNWVLGRYYRPRQEERVFMFLDLKGSTTLGEQMGDLAFSRLIQRFFEDMSDPVLKTKGEVSHYIGDEAVLTWKLDRGLKDANCLKMFFLMEDAVEANRQTYLRDFGVVPEFKAGAHLGSVVATQVGEIKSEIVFHGDVLNTTSRIQSLCNDLGSPFLISKDLKDALQASEGLAFEDRGKHSLKGKGQEVELVRVLRDSGQAASDKSFLR